MTFKKFVSLILCTCTLLSLFVLNPSTAFAASKENTYTINGVSISISDYSSSPSECWAFCQNYYKKIWGQSFSSSFAEKTNMLRELSDEQLVLDEAHLKAYVSQAPIGSVLRICSAEYLHSHDKRGHSVFIVQKDKDGFTVFEGGLSKSPYRREHYYTWSEFVSEYDKYDYIKYIKAPDAGLFAPNRCDHSYNEIYICTVCGSVDCTPVEATYTGPAVVKVDDNDGAYLRRSCYAVSGGDNCTFVPKGTVLEILGSFINRQGNLWYQVMTKDGDLYYIYHERVELGKSTLYISISNTPSNLSSGSGFSLRGTVSSSYTITHISGDIICAANGQVVQHVEENCDSNEVDIRQSVVNKELKFGNLASGQYSLRIEA